MVRDAFREATTGSLGACHLSLPMDVQAGSVDPGEAHADSATARYPSQRLAPDPGAVKQVARLLADSRRPLLVAGAGVIRSGAWEEVTALARTLGAPLATSICGKGAIAETDPLSLGVIGSNGGLPYRHDLVRKADVIFYLGCGLGSVTTEKWTLPTQGQASILQLDTNPEIVGRSYAVDAFVHSDAKLGVAALLEELGGPSAGDRIDPREIAEGRATHMAQVAELFASTATPIRPERMLAELFDVLPEDAVVIADPGTPCPYLSAYYQLPQAGRWFVSPRAFGALGYALPGVVGAYFAKPDAGRVVGVMGDGSFGISAGELETLVRLDVPVTLIVCNNAGYGWIKAGQKSRGSTFYSVEFGQSDHAAIARAYGMSALRVEDPADLGTAMGEALTAPGPFLLDVVMQPLEEANAPVSKWIA
jgi:acetolactate synthase-1/2/3 large subunit